MRLSPAAWILLGSAIVILTSAGLPRGAVADPPEPPLAPPAAAQTTIGELRVSQGWMWDLFGRTRETWRKSDGPLEGQNAPPPRSELTGTYRALCVRLCDGFPYPISHATTRAGLAASARQCEQSCPGRSRLFVHRQSEQAPEDLIDLKGRPYRELTTAFRYRTDYDASCTCRGNPWDEQAMARHRAYAEAQKGAPIASSETQEKPAKSQRVSKGPANWTRANRTARSSWQRDDDD